MAKKVVRILIIGLLISTIFPVVSSVNQPKLSPQIEIEIKGGWGIHVIIKNIGTTDIKDANMKIVLDGPMIFRNYKNREVTIDLKAGKTMHNIFPILGFGTTNIEITLDTTTQTASGKILGFIALGVK
jgi:hypothetical protein